MASKANPLLHRLRTWRYYVVSLAMVGAMIEGFNYITRNLDHLALGYLWIAAMGVVGVLGFRWAESRTNARL
jgi:hypothetical protein